MNYEQDACWDTPSDKDILYSELMGAETQKTFPERGIWWNDNTVYNQWLEPFTKMACGSYWTIHGVNIYNKLDGEYEIDPKDHRALFVKAYKTDSYDPVVKGSSLQNQVDFARKLNHIAGYTRIDKLKKEDYMENLAEWRCILTGSSNINWKKTRDSADKFAVIEKWAGHIVLIRGYWPKGLVCRNSYWHNYMDDGDFYIRREDIGALFSCYALVDYKDPLFESLLKRIQAKNKKKAETHWYGVKDWKLWRHLK